MPEGDYYIVHTRLSPGCPIRDHLDSGVITDRPEWGPESSPLITFLGLPGGNAAYKLDLRPFPATK